MNGFSEDHHRALARRDRVTSHYRPQRARIFGVACSLALAGLATTLILGQSIALAQQTKPAGKGASSAAGNPPAQADAASTTPGNAENGKRLFVKDGCYECHDIQGQGGAGTGPRLAQNPITFSAFVDQLRQPSDQMPPFTAKVLSDAEVADIYAYLHSIPKPPAVSSLPLLQEK